jgi:hypothetical protein
VDDAHKVGAIEEGHPVVGGADLVGGWRPGIGVEVEGTAGAGVVALVAVRAAPHQPGLADGPRQAQHGRAIPGDGDISKQGFDSRWNQTPGRSTEHFVEPWRSFNRGFPPSLPVPAGDEEESFGTPMFIAWQPDANGAVAPAPRGIDGRNDDARGRRLATLPADRVHEHPLQTRAIEGRGCNARGRRHELQGEYQTQRAKPAEETNGHHALL